MGDFRRRLMSQAGESLGNGTTVNDYIQNGLVFHLDGIERGIQGTWKDLKSNILFDLNNVIEKEDGIKFNGINSYGINDTETKHILGTEIECCFSVDSVDTKDFAILFHNYNNEDTISFVVDNKNKYILDRNYKYTNFLEFQSLSIHNAFSLYLGEQKKYLIHNAVSSNKIGYAAPYVVKNDNKKITLGAREISDSTYDLLFKGTLHSIRIYNRSLTEGEAIYNQNIDNLRFFNNEGF